LWKRKSIITISGKCSSCWAFAATAVLESQHAIHKHPPSAISLSEQQLIDCDRDTEDTGCGAGFPAVALSYAQKEGLINSIDYPYVGEGSEKCKAEGFNGTRVYADAVYSWTKKPSSDQLAEWIYRYGPVSAIYHDLQLTHL